MDNNELYHFGIKGMKWGVRRYQNKDGTLTNAGRKRRQENTHDDYRKVHDKKSIKSMSDAELRSRNNRLQMEKQYEQLTATPKRTNAGAKFVKDILINAGKQTLTNYTAKYMAKGVDKLIEKAMEQATSGS